MRATIVILLVAAVRASALGQEQETKLADRLLRPNTELQNEAQNKKFLGRSVTAQPRQATLREFNVRDRDLTKNFLGTRSITMRTARTMTFGSQKSTAYVGSRNKVPDATFGTQSSRLIRRSYDADKNSSQREFATNKFEARGKSQKTLNAQNHAMTIDEVRELLNKSK